MATYTVVTTDRLSHYNDKIQAWANARFALESALFDGSYESLEDLPTLDGTELKGELTKEGLGIAAKTWVTSQGYQNATEVENAIKAAIAGLYTPKGTVTFANLPQTLTATELGNVYNVSDGGTTDARFVEGAGKTLGEGANVVVIEETSGVYKFDVLGAMVDLTAYCTTANMQSYVGTQLESYTTTEGLNTKLNGYLLKTDVEECTDAEIDSWFN